MDKIIVGIASVYNRISSLKIVIQSLQKQTVQPHLINVYLNDYSGCPEFLNQDNIQVFLGYKLGNIGDIGKFYKIEESDGIYFSVDDDIQYPTNYIEYMLKGLKYFNNKKIVTFHGSLLTKFPVTNYFIDRKLFNFKRELLKPVSVHIGGTGVMCFDTKNFKLRLQDFKFPNSADIFVGLAAQRQKVGITILPHKTKWLYPLPNTVVNSIFQKQIRDKKISKLIADNINVLQKWELY